MTLVKYALTGRRFPEAQADILPITSVGTGPLGGKGCWLPNFSLPSYLLHPVQGGAPGCQQWGAMTV